MSILIPANSAVGGGDFVTNGVRFNTQSSTEYMQRTMTNNGNLQAWTVSVWVKRAVISDGQHMLFAAYNNSSHNTECFFEGNDTLNFRDLENGSFQFQKKTTQKFRDPSAWYHLVMSSSSGTQRIYVNGVEVTAWDTNTNGSGTSTWNNDKSHSIGANVNGSSDKAGLYMSEFTSIDGQTLTATSFGEFNEDSGVWQPKEVTELTFGTNGFYLPFSNSSALGEDFSGNDLDFALNNMDATNQTTDTCQNNFATFNPLFTPNPSNVSTFTEGNLKVVTNSTSQNSDGLSTIGVSSGKWYGEFKLTAEATGESLCGIKNNIENPTTNGLHGTGGFSVASNGDSFNNGSSQGAGNFSASYTTNDIIGIALDLDNNRVYFSKNGSYTDGSGNFDESSPTGYFSVTSGQTYFMGVGDKSTSQSSTWEANYGSPFFAISSGNADGNGYGNFEYAVPSGYLALNTKNLSKVDS